MTAAYSIAAPAGVATKVCYKCGECKPATTEFFHKRTHRAIIGLQHRCKECVRAWNKEYAEQNRDRHLERCKEYRARNPVNNRIRTAVTEELKKRRNERKKERRGKCSLFRLKCSIRSLILEKFYQNGFTKKSKATEILGCDFEFLKLHIERQFLPGMSWENRSEWHIDHIIPLATAKTEEDVIRLNHYTNLRPLWAKDNLRKGARIDYII